MKLFKCKFAQAPLFLTFEQSFMFLFTNSENSSFFFSSSNLVKLDLDLDPVPLKMNADSQPWFQDLLTFCNNINHADVSECGPPPGRDAGCPHRPL